MVQITIMFKGGRKKLEKLFLSYPTSLIYKLSNLLKVNLKIKKKKIAVPAHKDYFF